MASDDDAPLPLPPLIDERDDDSDADEMAALAKLRFTLATRGVESGDAATDDDALTDGER